MALIRARHVRPHGTLWAREVAAIETDFFAYLDLVGFIDEELRRRAARAFTHLESAAKGSLPKYMIESAEQYIAVLEEIIVTIDSELGVRTAMSTARQRSISEQGPHADE